MLYQYYFNISNTEFIRIYKISFPPIPSAVPTLSRLMRLRVSTAFQALRASSRDDQINLVLCFIWFHDVNFEIWLILHTNVCILYIYIIYICIYTLHLNLLTQFLIDVNIWQTTNLCQIFPQLASLGVSNGMGFLSLKWVMKGFWKRGFVANQTSTKDEGHRAI